MIEVIGKAYSKAIQTECGNCGSVLRFYPQDIQAKQVADYDGFRYQFRYITCPVCLKEVGVA